MATTPAGNTCSLCGRAVDAQAFDREGRDPGEAKPPIAICGACQDRLRAEATRRPMEP